MSHPSQDAQTGGSRFPAPPDLAIGVLATRQALQCRLGPALAVLGGLILLVALLTAFALGRIASIVILATAAAVAMTLIAYERNRRRRHGIWAKPAGDPSLAAPSAASIPDPKTTHWVGLIGFLVVALLIAGAYVYGAALDSLLFWVVVYGIVHMVLYTLSMWLNLGLREQAVAVIWFILGGLYWVGTGSSLALVFGGGFALTGLLLWRRLRRLEKLVHPLTAADRFEATQ